MKKMMIALLATAIAASSLSAAAVKKTGFFTTEECLKQGYFTNCRLSNYTDPDTKLVLYVHKELDYYYIDTSKMAKHELDEGFARNDVSITGELKGKTIIGTKYDGPPPPKQSFFKGCL